MADASPFFFTNDIRSLILGSCLHMEWGKQKGWETWKTRGILPPVGNLVLAHKEGAGKDLPALACLI